MKKKIIYTDGSCIPNPGPGGWAALIFSNGEQEMVSGSSAQSTNNRMELTAALESLKRLQTRSTLELHTDSLYLKRGITEWLENWKARKWKRKGGRLANKDLWKALADEIENHDITWVWVKGHAGNQYNEKVDREAQRMALQARKKR